jgi:hypothetical protein
MEKIEIFKTIKTLAARSLLALTLSSAPILDTGCSGPAQTEMAQVELESMRVLKESLNQEYLNNPEIIHQKEFFEKIQWIYIYEEYLGYCERENKEINKEDFTERVMDGFLGNIINQAQNTNQIETLDDAIAFALKLKTLFQESLGRSDAYEKNHPNFVDPALEQAFQCRSGTENMLWLLSKFPGIEKVGRLVYIHTNGHVLPGFIIENNLYGIESTAADKGLVEFGDIDKITVPIVITDYRHTLTGLVIPDVPENLKNILDRADRDQDRENKAMSEAETESQLGVHSNGKSFGESKVPPGRRELSPRNIIPADSYRREFNQYYSEDNNSADSTPSPEINNLLNAYNLQYQVQMNEFWNRQTDLFNNPPPTEAEFKEQANKLMSDYNKFLNENPAQDKYQELKEKLKSINQDLSMKSPHQIHDAIINNLNITLNRNY